eukprot:1159555-Pelagomonas_calceolata.AAC.18
MAHMCSLPTLCDFCSALAVRPIRGDPTSCMAKPHCGLAASSKWIRGGHSPVAPWHTNRRSRAQHAEGTCCSASSYWVGTEVSASVALVLQCSLPHKIELLKPCWLGICMFSGQR